MREKTPCNPGNSAFQLLKYHWFGCSILSLSWGLQSSQKESVEKRWFANPPPPRQPRWGMCFFKRERRIQIGCEGLLCWTTSTSGRCQHVVTGGTILISICLSIWLIMLEIPARNKAKPKFLCSTAASSGDFGKGRKGWSSLSSHSHSSCLCGCLHL